MKSCANYNKTRLGRVAVLVTVGWLIFYIQIKSRQVGEKIGRKIKINKRMCGTVKVLQLLAQSHIKSATIKKKQYTVFRKHYLSKKLGQLSQTIGGCYFTRVLCCGAEISASWHWQYWWPRPDHLEGEAGVERLEAAFARILEAELDRLPSYKKYQPSFSCQPYCFSSQSSIILHLIPF
jgi:hypothetical protein